MDDDDTPVPQHHQRLQQLLQRQQQELLQLQQKQEIEIEQQPQLQLQYFRSITFALLQQLIEEAARIATDRDDPIHPRSLCIESVLRCEQFPTRQRRKIDQLIGTYPANLKIQQEPQELIEELIQIQEQERKKDGVVTTSPLLGLLQQLFERTARVGTDRNDPRDNDQIQSRLRCIESLLRGKQFSGQQRRKITGFAKEFIMNLKKDVHDMITDQRHGEHYDGLDRERDAIEEVKSILQIFPDLIQKRKTTSFILNFDSDNEDEEDEGVGEWVDNENVDEGEFPIQCLVCVMDNVGTIYLNIKAVPFIHLFAQLALEYNAFDDDQRGGLLIEDRNGCNTFQNLLLEYENLESSEIINWCRADEARTNELIRLRRLDLLTAWEVQAYGLLDSPCQHYKFPHMSMTLLIEWSPNILLQPMGARGDSSLHYAAISSFIFNFRFLFQFIIRYFPYKTGINLLFRRGYRYKPGITCTPFGLACEKFERQSVIDVVEDVLTQYSDTTPINTIEALVLAATDPTVHLGCLYFLIQRQPDILSSSGIKNKGIIAPSLLSKSSTNTCVRDEDSLAGDRVRDSNSNGNISNIDGGTNDDGGGRKNNTEFKSEYDTDAEHADENHPSTTTTAAAAAAAAANTLTIRKPKRKRDDDQEKDEKED